MIIYTVLTFKHFFILLLAHSYFRTDFVKKRIIKSLYQVSMLHITTKIFTFLKIYSEMTEENTNLTIGKGYNIKMFIKIINHNVKKNIKITTKFLLSILFLFLWINNISIIFLCQFFKMNELPELLVFGVALHQQ